MTLVSSGTKIAALCDIHGNLPALEAVPADVRSEGVDQVIVGGNVIPGRCPAARVRDVIRWVAGEVSDERAARLSSWPATLRVDLPLGRILFCHASPRNDTEIFTSRTAAEIK